MRKLLSPFPSFFLPHLTLHSEFTALLSCGLSAGTHENEFCLGFATRQVDTMELSCVSVFIEQAPDRETGVNVHTNAFLEDMRRAEKKGAADKQAEQERYLRHWHRKWADPEHSSDDDTNSDSDSDSDGFNSTATEAGSEPELSSGLLSPESADGTTRGSRPSSRSGSPSGQHLSPPDDTKRARSPSPKRRNRLVRMVKKKAHAVVDTVKHRKAKHKAVTAENRENVAIASLLSELKTAKKRFHKSQMWRIGRLHIHDCAINRYGKDLRLGTEGWVLTAFIGSQKHLKKTIGSGVSKVAHPLRQLVHQKIFHKSAKSPDLPRACWAPSQSAPGADSP